VTDKSDWLLAVGAVLLVGGFLFGMFLDDRHKHVERMAMIERGVIPPQENAFGCRSRIVILTGDGGTP
jgi:hypothetical protein